MISIASIFNRKKRRRKKAAAPCIACRKVARLNSELTSLLSEAKYRATEARRDADEARAIAEARSDDASKRLKFEGALRYAMMALEDLNFSAAHEIVFRAIYNYPPGSGEQLPIPAAMKKSPSPEKAVTGNAAVGASAFGGGEHSSGED